MKNIITISLCLLFLCGCSSQKTSWSEIEKTYDSIKDEVYKITDTVDAISKADYKTLIEELDTYVGDIEYSQSKDNQELVKRIYKVAEYIEKFASLFNNDSSSKLLELTNNVKKLCQSVYDGNEKDFEDTKKEVEHAIDNIDNWTSEEWSSVEKSANIVWSDIESSIEDLKKEIENNLLDANEITESELDNYKHIIIDNYEIIKNGVTEETDDLAKEMYSASIKLQEYTEDISNKYAENVNEFAKHAQLYIEECYGKKLNSEEKLEDSFSVDVEKAKKWTQSTWNEITKELKKYQ